MLPQTHSKLFAAGLLFAAFGLPAAATALTLETVIHPFTGDDSSVHIVLEESAGDILFTVSVDEGYGDLRGVFFDIADDSLLSSLSVTGADVTGFETGGVDNLGRGVNLRGGGTPCPCDVAVGLGSPGMGKDDIWSTQFLLSSSLGDIDLSLFFDQSIGVRVTSVGESLNRRSGSSKLGGTLPVPEPDTAGLVALGLVALGVWRRR